LVEWLGWSVLQIMRKLNTDAIKLKGDIAQKTAETTNFYIMILGTFMFPDSL
jgi:hypothetical protein